MAKFCQNCGTPYEEGAMFCAGCGSNLTAGTTPKKKKSAITLDAVRDLAAKRIKAVMVFMLIATLLLGLAYVSGSYKATLTNISDGKVSSVSEVEVKALYTYNSTKEVNAVQVCTKVLNIVYGVALLVVAAMAAWAILENACGGNGAAIFKLASLIAAIGTILFALLFLILCRRSIDSYGTTMTVIVEVPVSAWVNIAVFGGVSAVACLQPKKA